MTYLRARRARLRRSILGMGGGYRGGCLSQAGWGFYGLCRGRGREMRPKGQKGEKKEERKGSLCIVSVLPRILPSMV